MKKTLMLVSTLICLFLFVFTSCEFNKPDSNKPSDGGTTNVEGVIFDNKTNLSIVINEDNVPYSAAEELWRAVKSQKLPRIIYDTNPKAAHEIVVGKTSRQISIDAYKRLENMAEESEYAQILIYSDGSSVAIAYEENRYSLDIAIDYFIEKYLGESTLIIEKGVDSATDILKLQQAKDDAMVDMQWAEIERAVGPEITKALQTHYTLYSDDLIDWYANLYEPNVCVCVGECQNTQYCGGGGYYYSNSARNTLGYLPDLEATAHSLNFLVSSGMSEGAPYGDLIPDWMKEQIIRFAKARQNPNGYFYHPQWTMAAVDASVSRRSRDLDWGTSILWELGSQPTYDTPDGYKGDGILWDGTPVAKEALVGRLSGVCAVSAVSKAINNLTATAYPSFLESTSTFDKYLKSLDIEGRSYHVGSDLVALTSEIKARDKSIGTQNDPTPLADILIQYLNSHQNPETGLWGDRTDYYAVNGLFKITGCYTDTGNPMPYVDKALKAAMGAITSQEEVGAVVDIYNTWYTVLNVLDNIEKCHGLAAADTAEAAIKEIRANAVELIKATSAKISLFRKDDGSFSYNQKYSSSTSQGMPAAVPSTNEGDENATIIATTGLTVRMMKVLGVEYVPMYTKADWIRYEYILENLGPVIKHEETPPEINTFDGEIVDESPTSVTIEYSNNNFTGTEYPKNNGVSTITDPTGSGKGNIVEINSVTGYYHSITIKNTNNALNKPCSVFEGDVCIPDSQNGYVVRLRMSDLYAFAFKVNDGNVNIWDVSTSYSENLLETDLGVSIPLGEWFNMKVEYYNGDHDTVRMKLYINNKLVAVNDNYYDQYGKKLTNASGIGVPNTTYPYFGFSTMSGYNTKIYLDNVRCYATSTRYEPYADTENPLKVNVDMPDPGEIVYPFDDVESAETLPENFKVNGDGVAIVTDKGTDKVLSMVNGETSPVLGIIANKRAYKANTAVAGFTFVVKGSSRVGSAMRLTLCENSSAATALAMLDFVVIEEDGIRYVTVADVDGGVTGSPMLGFKKPLGIPIKFMVEYYEDAEMTLIYLDGKLVAASNIVTMAAGGIKPGLLNISFANATDMNVTFDDLKFEYVLKDYDPAVLEIGTDKKYTFNDTASTLPGTTVTTENGDKFASLSAAEGIITIPVNNRSPLISMTTLKAGLGFSEGADGKWLLSYKNERGETVAALLLEVSGGKLRVYEYDKSGAGTKVIGEIDCTTEIAFEATWYKSYTVANLLANAKYLAATTKNYDSATVTTYVSSIEISAMGGEGSLYIDDIIAEKLNELSEGTDEGEGSEEGNEVITFDGTSSVANLPSVITHSLRSTGSQFKLERTIREGILTKVISLTSYTGNNDEINVYLTKKDGAATVTTFEADVYINSTTGVSSAVQFFLYAGNSYAYRINMYDAQKYLDIDGTDKFENEEAFPGYATWFRLKIEYYDGGKVIIYANDKPVATSANFNGGAPAAAVNISRMRIYTTGAFEGQIKLDNVSFIQSVKEYVAPTIE